MLVDDPLLTVREVYRERPLTRVIFDRRLRTSAGGACLLDARGRAGDNTDAPEAVQREPARGCGAERAGRHGACALTRTASRRPCVSCTARDVQSLLIEGGAALHAAVWDAGLVDYVQLYVAPPWLGERGCAAARRARVFAGVAVRAAGRAARSGCDDRRICSPASLKPSATSAVSRRPQPGIADAHSNRARRRLLAGESVAVNGVCLTVTSVEGGRVHADIGPETARVTTLGALQAGSAGQPRARDARRRPVRRPLRAGPRGRDRDWSRRCGADGDAHWLTIAFPAALAPLLIAQGSVAVDGVSLTVAALRDGAVRRHDHSVHLGAHEPVGAACWRPRQPGMRHGGQVRRPRGGTR